MHLCHDCGERIESGEQWLPLPYMASRCIGCAESCMRCGDLAAMLAEWIACQRILARMCQGWVTDDPPEPRPPGTVGAFPADDQ